MRAREVRNAALRRWQDSIVAGLVVQMRPDLPECDGPENPVTFPVASPKPDHPARLILILSLAPTIGLGIGRFAYSLVLPDMRDTLGWSYSVAGFMNTVNAAGYLAGALAAAPLIRRFGLPAAVRWSTLACLLSLALSALSGNFFVLSFARL